MVDPNSLNLGPEFETVGDDNVKIASATDPSYDNVELGDELLSSFQQPYFEQYRFPENLAINYPARIIFKIYRVESNLENLEAIENAISEIKKSFNDTANQVEEEIVNIGQVAEGAEGTTGVVANALAPIAQVGTAVTNYTLLGVESVGNFISGTASELSRSPIENKEQNTHLVTITLPLPRGLRYSDAATYNTNADTNFGMGAISSIGNAITGDDGSLRGATLGMTANLIAKSAGIAAPTAIGSIFGKKGAGLGFLTGAITGAGENLGNAARQATRYTSNPDTRTIFDRVPIRTFSFPFKLIAKSENEAKQIRQIIKTFRKHMYPEAINSTVELNGTSYEFPFAYRFPDVFGIEIKDNLNNDLGMKIQKCYLQSMDTSFNQTANGIYEGSQGDGYFVEVDITLNFVEYRTLDRAKIEDGY